MATQNKALIREKTLWECASRFWSVSSGRTAWCGIKTSKTNKSFHHEINVCVCVVVVVESDDKSESNAHHCCQLHSHPTTITTHGGQKWGLVRLPILRTLFNVSIVLVVLITRWVLRVLSKRVNSLFVVSAQWWFFVNEQCRLKPQLQSWNPHNPKRWLCRLWSTNYRTGTPTSAQICLTCLIELQIVIALGKSWHPEHYVCSQCGQELGRQPYFERGGKAFCENDYFELFSPKCAYCNGPIREVIWMFILKLHSF